MTNGGRKIKGEVAITSETEKTAEEVSHLPAYQKAIEDNLGVPTTKFLEIIMAGAVNLNASDIHFEPEEEKVKMRLRIDGVLQDVTHLRNEDYEDLLSRLKLISGLKLNISDRPQDGRFSIVFDQGKEDELEIEIRISSLPSEHGETVVMRILNPQSLKDIEELGLRPDLLKTVNEEIKKPNGMIVSTGPTGSGKTTTLYAFCKKLVSPKIKIITIEDPIEYHLDGLSQTQVDPNKGYDFASGLRSIVRQDPDVILVGEMRDKETVNMALQAALTGHLVLTTLHTNNAAGVVTRLISLEGKVANIGPALRMVLGQRLVRKVCDQCKEMRAPNEEEKKKIKAQLKNLPEKVEVHEMKKIPVPQGCPHCNDTGYRGRVGLFEAFIVDDEIEELISEKPSTSVLKKKAQEKGMTTLKQDGIIKILEGVTTLEEVKRVTG